MKRHAAPRVAFSLVELTLALGVAAFCLLAVFGLLPIGERSNLNATGDVMAASIVNAVAADLRATPKTLNTSAQYGLTFGAATTLYFDGTGQFSPTLSATSRYRVAVAFPTNPSGANAAKFAHLKITWPAAAAQADAAGSSEAFAAFDR